MRIENVALDGNMVTLTVAVKGARARRPLCQHRSTRVHSRYQRMVADLPVSGRAVAVVVQVRRFRCLASSCPRRIFAERLPSLVAPHARNSHGLCQALEQVGFANGGEAGARLAGHLGMHTSPDTLLRLIRAVPCPDSGQPTVIGIDDWGATRSRIA